VAYKQETPTFIERATKTRLLDISQAEVNVINIVHITMEFFANQVDQYSMMLIRL
jgi:hypothetical protein